LTGIIVFPDCAGAMLNCIPNLTSIVLNACKGARHFVVCIGTTVNNGFRPELMRRRMKFCPHLETLSFTTCYDLDFGTLGITMGIRNSLAADLEDIRLDRDSISPSQIHSRIRWVVIIGCVISEMDALSLKECGVEDVTWLP
jgi:hypothetical protein